MHEHRARRHGLDEATDLRRGLMCQRQETYPGPGTHTRLSSALNKANRSPLGSSPIASDLVPARICRYGTRCHEDQATSVSSRGGPTGRSITVGWDEAAGPLLNQLTR